MPSHPGCFQNEDNFIALFLIIMLYEHWELGKYRNTEEVLISKKNSKSPNPEANHSHFGEHPSEYFRMRVTQINLQQGDCCTCCFPVCFYSSIHRGLLSLPVIGIFFVLFSGYIVIFYMQTHHTLF